MGERETEFCFGSKRGPHYFLSSITVGSVKDERAPMHSHLEKVKPHESAFHSRISHRRFVGCPWKI